MDQSSVSSKLESYLLTHIPLSNALGIKVETANLHLVKIKASFLNNINHKKTVFGGSLHAVATLACWSLLHLNLTEHFSNDFQIVISKSEVDYLAPVSEDFIAECCKPDQENWDRFIKSLERKGKGRINVSARIHQGDRLSVDYSGTFVALLQNNES